MSDGIRRVCFVTGTRAEFGLMQSVLRAIQIHPQLQFQLIVTGMHLHARHGSTIKSIHAKIDAVVPWKLADNPAEPTGLAMARLAREFQRLKTDIVLVVGDRVEAFAAAAAGHIAGKIVAHIHGGDRAPGQIDDSLRHAITKLSHIHFPVTPNSAARLLKLGEDRWRIHSVGSPGIDGIAASANGSNRLHLRFPELMKNRYALVVLHPVHSTGEFRHARMILDAVKRAGIKQTVVIYPNNDPGAAEIIRCWNEHKNKITYLLKDAPRRDFLGLMRDAALMIGNSSSGIIEAASFGTPVINIGPRQLGRDRSGNVCDVSHNRQQVIAAVRAVWNNGHPRRWRGRNVYDGRNTGRRIAAVLAKVRLDDRLSRKLIAY